MTALPVQRDPAMSDHDLLVRMDEKMTSFITTQGGINRDHESRIRVSERFRWLLVGAGTVGGGALGALFSPLLHGAVH